MISYTMKSSIFILLSAPAIFTAVNGYIQLASGKASFTEYSGCSAPGKFQD